MKLRWIEIGLYCFIFLMPLDMAMHALEETKQVNENVDAKKTIPQLDEEIKKVNNEAEKLHLQIEWLFRQMNELPNGDSEKYHTLMSLAFEKEQELEKTHLKEDQLRLDRKLLLMEQGDPDNLEDSPYQP